ncbi:MAG: 3-hydroxy-9,10-secoandrosta-1,3,5(10)-triene-9,17-dione monooxygenase [Paracoccaceae bacterium]|jgi:3-hydroxy-9,10-secoandrosta-1,3,5(10)-triene-9,17-dione monooxygenase
MDAEVTNMPSVEDLVERARALVPTLAERAAATEDNRSMLPETLKDLTEAGLFKVMQARRYGGYEMGLPAMAEITAEIARGSASDAWIVGLCGNQNRFIGCYPAEAQEEVYAKSGDHLISCLVTGPTTTAERVDGGFRLSGKWPYVSGVDQCNWLLLSAFDGGAEEGGAAASLTFLVPRDAVADVIDDWHVMGLRGTGSKTVVLEDVFVPEYRALNMWNYDADPPPGAAVNPGAMFQGVPRIMIFTTMLAAPALGIAQSAVEAYRDRLETRASALMSGKQSENAVSQIALGRAMEQAAMARDTLLAAANDFQRRAEAGDTFTAEDRIGHRLRMSEVMRLCTQVVTDVFMDAGTGAMFDRNPLQRMFRDMYAIRSHVVIDPNNAAENRGRLSLGIDPKPPFV